MEKTEDEILALLAGQKPMSIAQISDALNLTKADIRYHINKLLKAKKLTTTSPSDGERGRPALRFKVTPSYFADNYSFLLEEFLKTFLINEENLMNLIDQVASSLSINPSQPIISRINDLVSILRRLNYAARWETRFTGPLIIFMNCPYRQLANKHPQFCRIDQKLIERTINKKINTINTIANNQTTSCAFQVLINDYQ